MPVHQLEYRVRSYGARARYHTEIGDVEEGLAWYARAYLASLYLDRAEEAAKQA
jgi:hypothetical protein